MEKRAGMSFMIWTMNPEYGRNVQYVKVQEILDFGIGSGAKCLYGLQNGMRNGDGTMKEEKRHPKGKGCWYRTIVYYCVLCGRENTYRERMWTPKPEKWNERYIIKEEACWSHFLQNRAWVKKYPPTLKKVEEKGKGWAYEVQYRSIIQ